MTAIPILPGGVGTGHAAFSFFLQLIGSLQGADAFSFSVLGNLVIGGVGGLIYLRFKSTHPSAHLSHLQDAEEAERRRNHIDPPSH